ncbi:MAG: metallophosphoesterase [Spirochaetaceae bacterium]|jgi:predicted phosphodiesterase|nr:metallophosphoesterase [Spirochaetaceae bacterium]
MKNPDASFSHSFFADMLSPRFDIEAALDISRRGRVVVVSDLHMGGGRGDDLEFNGGLLHTILEQYYFPSGWNLLLNGDIEELQRYSLDSIRAKWPQFYRLFDRFAAEGRFFKTLGNHDEALLFERDYPYPLFNSVRIETPQFPVFVYHGHQSSRMYTEFNHIVGAGIRYLLKPFGIRNLSTARSPNRRFFVEKQAYYFSLRNRCVSIIGHTHRALFESLGRFEIIKYEIERLCRDYTDADSNGRERIKNEIDALRVDLGKLRRRERRDALKQSLYGDELPVPCLFNSGCAIGRQGFNAIELDRDTISLVYWFTEGASRKFVNRGWYQVEKFGATPYRRVVLNSGSLNYIKARIELLG